MKNPDKNTADEMMIDERSNVDNMAEVGAPGSDSVPARKRASAKHAVIRRPCKDDIKQMIMMTIITIAIILAGVSVPALVVSKHTSAAALPAGETQVEDIKSYGAEAMEVEMQVAEAWGELTYIDYYYYENVCQPSFSVDSSDRYAGIGSVSEDPHGDGRDECFYALTELTCQTLGGEIPSHWDGFDNGSRLMILSADLSMGEPIGNTFSILDSSNGLPLEYRIRFIAPHDYIDEADIEGVMTQLTHDIISAYNEYTGLEFVDDDDQNLWYTDEGTGWDYYICNTVRSTDGRMEIYMWIESGYFWAYEDGEYSPTDNFIWDVSVVLYYE